MQPETIGVFLLFGSLFLLIFIRIPIAFALGISSVITALYLEIPLLFIVKRLITGLDLFVFLAVPFFILTARVMIECGISDKLIMLAKVLVGRVRGGTAMVNVVVSMFFGGVSGSSVADVSSIGSLLIPAMVKEGYDEDYSVAVTVTSSLQGVIIPPSQNMIYFSLAAGGVSISSLFLAGYIPGILLGVSLMAVAYIIAVIRNYPTTKVSFKSSLAIITEALWGLFTMVIIVGGIVLGIFTATESAAVACVYAILITALVYRNMSWEKMKRVFLSSFEPLAMITLIIAASSGFGFILAFLEVPSMVAEFFLAISDNPIVIMILINLLMLLLGMFMDMGVLILLLTPILLPIVTAIGMDPIHFGVVMVLNLGIGLCTPPVGTSLFVGCAIAGIPIEKSLKAFIPFYLVMLVLLVVIITVPELTLWLPSLF